MEDVKRFCTACGANLPEDGEFCPYCGKSIESDSGQSESYQSAAAPAYAAPKSGSLKDLAVLIGLYSVMAIMVGGFLVFIGVDIDYIMEIMQETNPDVYEQFIELGISTSQFAMYYIIPGALLIASGAVAVISCYFTLGARNYKMAYMTCVISSILSFPLIITLIVGIIVSSKLKNNQSSFAS
jgi:hypothetical protein